MSDHEYRERVTLLLVNDALEANQRDIAEAAKHLMDAVGTLIVHAQRQNGADGKASTDALVGYLQEQVQRYLERLP